MGRLDGKVALITGGARGQGRSHAVAMAREGAAVVVLDLIDQIGTVPYPLSVAEDLEERVSCVLRDGGRALGIRADVRNGQDLDAAVASTLETFGHIDILVANAGILSLAPLHEITREAWQDVIDVNLTGAWEALRAVIPTMISQESGAVVLTSSVNGFEGAANYAHYVAAKHGVLGLMKSAALEYGRFNIRVNAVCPGCVDTMMNDNPEGRRLSTGRSDATREEHLKAAHYWSALARRGALPVQSVSAAVLWLVSDEAADITGLAVPVDAGHSVLPGINGEPVFA